MWVDLAVLGRFLREHVVTRHSLLMAVPALLYTVQKNLLYVALTNLDACVYQATRDRHGIAGANWSQHGDTPRTCTRLEVRGLMLCYG